MIMDKQNGFSILVHLSNIELYYTPPEMITENEIILCDEEFHHCVNVMRNTVGDAVYITNGEGKIFKSNIHKITENKLIARIDTISEYENKSKNIWFCIPSLKKPDRLKFAFEKCVELGVTNFILFSSKHTISKKLRVEKFKRVILSAMKQSLRAYLPKITSASFSDIISLNGTKILFDQSAEQMFDKNFEFDETTHLFFGPEGGFDKNEFESVKQENQFKLATFRLRSETAIIKCASLLNLT